MVSDSAVIAVSRISAFSIPSAMKPPISIYLSREINFIYYEEGQI